jgi:hypothetical protein
LKIGKDKSGKGDVISSNGKGEFENKARRINQIIYGHCVKIISGSKILDMFEIRQNINTR